MIFQVFGPIGDPYGAGALNVLNYGIRGGSQGGALILLANNLIKFAILVAGIYAFINIIIAGYMFLSSTESKEISKAWAKIWQSMLGLFIMGGSFVLAAIFGYIIFGDPTALLVPKLYTP